MIIVYLMIGVNITKLLLLKIINGINSWMLDLAEGLTFSPDHIWTVGLSERTLRLYVEVDSIKLENSAWIIDSSRRLS